MQSDVTAFQLAQRGVRLLRVDLNVDLRHEAVLAGEGSVSYSTDGAGICFLLDPRLQLHRLSIDGDPVMWTRTGPLVQAKGSEGKHVLSADWSGNLVSEDDLGINGSSYDLNANLLWFPTLMWGARFDASFRLHVPNGTRAYFPSVARTAEDSTTMDSVMDVPLVGGVEIGSCQDGDVGVHSLVRPDPAALLRTAMTAFEWLEKRWGPRPFRLVNVIETRRRKRGAYSREGLIVCPNRSETAEKDIAQRLVHEATHQWWGIDVTPGERWFSEDWLSEGLATFSEYLWAKERGGDPAAREFLLNAEKQVQGLRGALATLSPWSQEGWTLSRSGAVLLLARLEEQVPDFIPLLKRFRDSRHGTFVTTDAFVHELSDHVAEEWLNEHVATTRGWPGDLAPG